ncbi:hypothetical protein F0U44_20765 [Nocardioides humilatus]|uniref:Uncharacterized protein n=1 Tax=Nocardioides humilatus TaxID=2607660 RepID=A0A5B1L5J3_9ACTN|nr:hypothetical protein [Nocardioides humilatus]KAA1415428.1 hypothetical protein F0U44_20765 [Nocardioides humilatus]
MKPLYAMAFGLILVALGPTGAKPDTFDPMPDPLGWLFVLIGLVSLAAVLDDARIGILRFLGATAMVFSIALVVPAVARWVATDPSLGWTADVPRFSFFAVLCYELSAAALKQKATVAASTFNLSALALLFVLAAPPVAFGGGIEEVGNAGEITAEIVQIVLVVLFFIYGSRPWAGAPVEAEAAGEPGAE